jgi:protein-S-isoprenylcysteine O-methyltransferase Ste14
MMYRIAALLLGLVIAGYWGRVIRMAQKARRKTGRAANFLPAEPIGRVLRFIWVPVVVLWVAHPFFTASVAHPPAPLRPLWQTAWAGFAGAALAASCFLATRACWKAMGAHWRMGIDPAERTALLIDGPFAYVRHPIYALSQAMMLATVIAIPSPVMIALALLHIGLMQWEAAREEKYLSQIYGRQYLDYRARVGRFIPRPRGSRA